MGTSPLALAASVIAAAILIRRAGLPPRVLAFEVRLAAAACAVMAVVLGAAAWWVATSGGSHLASGGLRPPFHAGLIDLACTGVLALALPVAAQGSRMARRELRLAGRGGGGTLTPGGDPGRTASRRRFLRYALGGAVAVAAAGAAGVELVDHGVLPGKSQLDQLDGACDVPAADFTPYATPGPQNSGTFYSAARRTTVGYTIGYPPGHAPQPAPARRRSLHGFTGNHANALGGITLAQAVALRLGGTPLPPLALVTADGGDSYWNPHPGDNPQAMLTDELIPLCQRAGLGAGSRRIGVLGISMGGYGAILLAEKNPRLIRAVAAISPAIWTSYAEDQSANAGAYASAADFAADDAVTPGRLRLRTRSTRASFLARLSDARPRGRGDCPGTPPLAPPGSRGFHLPGGSKPHSFGRAILVLPLVSVA